MKKVLHAMSAPFRAIGRWGKREFVDTWKGFTKEQIKPSTLILVIANIVCLLVSNIIAVKTLDAGLAFGSGSNFVEFKLPLAVLMYGAAVIISDVLAEKDWIWTRRSCHLGFLANLVMVGVFTITIYLPGTISGAAANGMESNIGTVLGSSWYMLVASMIAFFFGDLMNDTVFKKLKEKDGKGKGKLIKRCVVSTVCGQVLDSLIFITFGLYLLPMLFGTTPMVPGTNLHAPFIGFNWADFCLGAWGGYASVLASVAFQFVTKIVWEIAVSPIILAICKKETKVEA